MSPCSHILWKAIGIIGLKLARTTLDKFLTLPNNELMIPMAFHKIWEQGLKTNDYYLKLCGSGGGGYILGFAQDYEKAKNSLKDYKLELVYRF